MATTVVNSAGSTTFNIPSRLLRGMQLRFNVTNTNASTRYTGTIIPFTFPHWCKVKITAFGARGSYGNLYTYGLTETTRSGNGAKCIGTFTFEKGDQLLILVGQHGKDAMTGTSSTRDQTTGGGGGGTFIVKRVASSSYKMVGTSTNGSDAYSGWYITPLIIAAGGNGSRDNGYSGTSTTIYNGLGFTAGTAEALGTTSTSTTRLVGGTLSKEIGSTSSNGSSYRYGRCFLNGGLGSMYVYTRRSSAGAGFGCGAANADDGNGGGGGGWVSGYVGSSAKSFINTDLGTDYSSSDGANADDGYVLFDIIEAPPLIYAPKDDGTFVEGIDSYVYVNDTIKWVRVKDLYEMNSSGIWLRAK